MSLASSNPNSLPPNSAANSVAEITDTTFRLPEHVVLGVTHDESGVELGEKIDIASLTLPALKELMASWGEKPYRAQQVYRWLHQRLATSFEEMTDISKAMRQKLAEKAAILFPKVDHVSVSSDGTRKYRLKTYDGHSIESVFIPNASAPGRNALCISSQVGCAMGCTFCATASLKLTRHLAAGEIVGQLYAVLRDLDAVLGPMQPITVNMLDQAGDVDEDGNETEQGKKKAPRRVANIVYMGMGEPLHNYDGVISSIELFGSMDGMGYAARRLTVSTSGLVPQIAKLGVDTDVHIAISLNSTQDSVRNQVMPVNRRWNIDALLAACRDFPLKSRRRITFEYVMLAGVNDSDEDAHRLSGLMQGMRSKVNLIPFNPHPLSPFGRPDAERVEKFRSILDHAHISTFVRTTRGLDIDAACGMLGAEKLMKARADLGLADVDAEKSKRSLHVL